MTGFGGHQFSDPELLERALTHRSAAARNNERLEFLGDALLGAFIGEALFRRAPRAREGDLTRARAELVRRSALAEVARNLNVGPLLHLGPGELKSGGRKRDSILANAVEALIAAIHLDTGFEHCRNIVMPWFEPLIERLFADGFDKDPKTALQEALQAKQLALPEYEIIERSGEPHEQVFVARCSVADIEVVFDGRGSSRKLAEQAAAAAALDALEARA